MGGQPGPHGFPRMRLVVLDKRAAMTVAECRWLGRVRHQMEESENTAPYQADLPVLVVWAGA